MKSRTLNILIDRDPQKVYGFASNLKNLPKWAPTFCLSIKKSGGAWIAQTPQGPVKIRIAPKNRFGILDHTVIPAPGKEVFVPMRVVPSGKGCLVLFTLFQHPGMSAKQFAADSRLVRRDLKTLKSVLEKKDPDRVISKKRGISNKK